MRLAGKVALISGGARGMGAAEARLFAREGARVVIGDILVAEGQAVEAEIKAKGGEAAFARLDVTSEADWQAWWRGCRRYVLHHALLAAWAGSDLYSVGVELSKTLCREAEWRELIAAVRLLFPGALTYSGNWNGDLETAGFWDRLDYVGVDAYFPLATSPEARQEDLERGARQVVDRLAAAARRTGKPLLLTEVGFPAHRGAWVQPHTEGGAYSEEDQARAYEALLGALGRRPWLAGTFFWKAFSADESAWRQGEADFRFLGRKAEAVVREYYSPRAGL